MILLQSQSGLITVTRTAKNDDGGGRQGREIRGSAKVQIGAELLCKSAKVFFKS